MKLFRGGSSLLLTLAVLNPVLLLISKGQSGRIIGIPIDLSFLLYDIAEVGSIIWTWFL